MGLFTRIKHWIHNPYTRSGRHTLLVEAAGRAHELEPGSGRILLNLPGWDGHIDGYNRKYETLARFLAERGLATVLRVGNHPLPGLGFEQSCVLLARRLIAFATEHGRALCGASEAPLDLMGFSAGASAFAAVASDSPRIERLLLPAPSEDAGEPDWRASRAR